ncbi:translation initiation factor IF-3 [Metamycoplasma alkalescens]|uniref:Translation initiation factor IF-3 n=3 Tax=Metamycoplasma alkalescens TaxID=45363 RepID=N9UAQ6_9BACT|nr:Translation initiation factor IF-3 [Metamycoplasma alkalescens 14918]PYF42555.1 translation initiation factor IF-3 [Metamycoplasma alkalescens]SYV90439.1 translation initiation factor IF-3 [Metamycoplasma alkalescens]
MDLVLISIENNKPIVRIMDYGKFKYDKKKKQKIIKEKQAVTINREIRLTPLIGQHDLETKAKKAREFILDGNRVKVSVKFRGRERSRTELGEEILNKFYALVEDIAKITKEATLVNERFLDMYLEKDKKKVGTSNIKDN